VANRVILEKIINRKDVTMWGGNLGSRKESGEQVWTQQRGFRLHKLWGGFESSPATVSSLAQFFCKEPVKGKGFIERYLETFKHDSNLLIFVNVKIISV